MAPTRFGPDVIESDRKGNWVAHMSSADVCTIQHLQDTLVLRATRYATGHHRHTHAHNQAVEPPSIVELNTKNN